MQDNQSVTVSHITEDKEIDISKILITIWRGRLILLFSILFSLFIAILHLHNATYIYTAQIKVFPVQTSGSSGGKQLGGLASLAGISLPSDKQGSFFELYSEEIYAREVADALSSQTDLMKTIYKNEWDAENSGWKKPSSSLTPVIGAVKGALGIPVREWQAPNGRRLQDYIKANVTYDEKPKKATVTISYDDNDPAFAVRFLNALHKAADDRLRQRALERSTKFINYLNGKLQSTTVTEYKSALVAILSDQEKLNMIASSDVPYAAESIGGATASLKPTKPNPRIVLIAGVFAGLLIGLLIILVRYYVKGDGRPAKPEHISPSPITQEVGHAE